MITSLLVFLVYAAILSLVYYCIIALIPLPPTVRVVAQCVFGIILLLLLLQFLTGHGHFIL